MLKVFPSAHIQPRKMDTTNARKRTMSAEFYKNTKIDSC